MPGKSMEPPVMTECSIYFSKALISLPYLRHERLIIYILSFMHNVHGYLPQVFIDPVGVYRREYFGFHYFMTLLWVWFLFEILGEMIYKGI